MKQNTSKQMTTTLPQDTTPPNPQPKALRVLANIITYLFHPVFFPLIAAFAILELEPAGFIGLTQKQLVMWFASIGLTAVFFPLFSILLMKQLDFISSYRMPTAKERTIPLMATMIFYFWVSHVFNNMPGAPVPLALKVMLLGCFWGIIGVFMINIFTKISLHTTAAGGMVGVVVVLMLTSPANMLPALFASIVLAGIVGTARMVLGAHQRGDIWVGYIIGFAAQMAAYRYMR